MSFEKVDPLPNFPETERKILALWKERDVFHRSLEQSRGNTSFVFYEGPPTANGLPHNGHVLTRVMKDLFPRYRTMRGYHVERWAGWDTHGLPVEVEVEKELRIQGRQAILDYGVERFVKKCLESVFRYTTEWEHLTERLGFWVDLDQAYVTFHRRYVESVWWALSELFKKDLLYKGHKVVWWWAQGGTALSAGETGNAYRTVDDPSVYVRLPLVEEDASLLVWTTTPWTLPSNMFAAVHGEFDYVYAKDPETGHTLILAEALLPDLEKRLKRSLTKTTKVKGKDLVGRRYTPPFPTHARDLAPGDDRYFRVVLGDKSAGGAPQWFVTLEAGTGVVHTAPAFGDDDWKLWRNEQKKRPEIELFCAVRPDGTFDDRLGPLAGTWVKDADKALIKDLKERGLLVHAETYRHDYPFCWRSENDPLIQYARDTWFIRTTKIIDSVIENNQGVEWLPDHIRDGRMGDFLANNVDWALSRERFWGTPLNLWECKGCGHLEAPASCAEIEAKNPQAFAAFHRAKERDPSLSEHLMVHKPWIDEVQIPCARCKSPMLRVKEVIDCWFDSGCMPFAQFGFPATPGSKPAFSAAFPADFISEAIDQTRGWFYSLMMISNLLFPENKEVHPYKRCIVLGHVCDKKGKKESKSKGNYTPPELILDRVRMGFAPIEDREVAPIEGVALVAFEDLEGFDIANDAEVSVYRPDRPSEARTLKLRGDKRLERRVIVLPTGERDALGLALAPRDVRPAEVPTLPVSQQLMVEVHTPAPGSDAFRWFFYASNPPWNNTRHSLSNVRGLQKELPLKLRSVYAFFVTYANIDAFDPVKDEGHKRPVKDRTILDRWILSELERTKKAVVAHMDAFRSFEAAQALTAFVEGLSNWYVRRSRDRFWAAGRGQDKLDAFWTLYACLRDVSKLTAPFLPFQAEEIYQSLVARPYGAGPPNSVHLCSYPSGDQGLVDLALSEAMEVVRELVSLGLKVRTDNKLRVRQPLAEARIVLARPELLAMVEPYVAVMADELNTKSISFLERADSVCNYKVKPNFAVLGKRLGSRMKATQAAIGQAEPNWLKSELDAKGRVELQMDDGPVVLTSGELQVVVEAKEGFAAAGSAHGVVILDTKLNPELISEGLFRDVLAKIQSARKELKLDYQTRIKLSLTGDASLLGACRPRLEILKGEVLAKQVVFEEAIGGSRFESNIDGRALCVEVLDLSPPKK